MSFRHSSSISSEDEFLHRQLKSSMCRNGYAHNHLRQFHSKENRHDEDIPYSKDQRRRPEKRSKGMNIERSRRARGDSFSQRSESEDEIEYSKFDRLQSARNGLPSRRSRSYHCAIDVYQACQVTINYTKHSSSSSSSPIDEILIKQRVNKNSERVLVYKGYLKTNETFSFKSQHFAEYSFDVKFYVNGYVQDHLFSCCEYKYRRGGFRINQYFLILRVEKSFPCSKCRRREEKQNGEIPINSSLSDQRSLKSKDQTKSNANDEEATEENLRLTKSIVGENEKEDDVEEVPQSENKNENNSSSPIREMLTERGESNGENGRNLFQSLLLLLQNGFRRVEVHEPLPARYQGNVENFVVLLLGIVDQSNLIRSIFNFVQSFDNIEEFNSFLPTLQVEKRILIINDSMSETIEDLSQFHSIYYLSKNKKERNKDSNIRGNYRHIKSICEKLPEEYSIENDFILIQSVSSDEKEKKIFSYSQLLKETILTKDDEGNLKEDFINYCQYHYQGNDVQLNLLEQFQRDFTSEKSIWWFTRNCFIRKMLCRAFRTEDVEILFKMRWIIQSINTQIKENQFSKSVYRILHLSLNQLNKFKENCKGFISFGTFLDCSLDQPSSSSPLEHFNDMETILFHIKTTNGIEVNELRHPDSNIEILLSFDNVYQIESIEQLNNHYFLINLILLDKENEEYKELTDELRSEIEGPVVLIQLGKLLLLNDDYLHADYLARLLFDDHSLKDNPTLLASLAAVHHLLGSQDHRRNNHRAARLQFQRSLQIFLSFVPEDNQILSATYNNIGSMFYQEDEYEQAIHFHQKALQCQLKATTPDIDAIATYSGNIGAVYLDQKKYDQALINYKRSLQILQQSTPGGESQAIALVYDRIASVYWRMDKPDEALPFYQKALQLELKFLPENDHKISVSYFNLSTAYAKLDRLDEAIDAAEKSLQQLLKSVPPDHPEVKENTEQLEGLRRKKWIQQLYQ